MTVTRSRSKWSTSSREEAGDMIKMLLPSIYTFMDVDKIIFNTVNTNKPCHKKKKICEKAFNSYIIWVALEMVPELKKFVD